MEKEILDSYLKAGKIVIEARDYGASLIKVGASLKDVCDKIEEKVRSLKGELAFPVQISLNQIAAHYCPDDDDTVIFKEGDIAKLDIGVHINGYVADTAISVDLGNHAELMKASREALDNALKLIRPGVTLGEIGKVIQQTISSYGFAPIKNLSGHGLGEYEIHTKPTIPNFDTGDSTRLKEDQVIAIEPFATTGKGMIFESTNATIFSQTDKKPVRSPFAREILAYIQQYRALPFAKRWLVRKFGLGKTNFALRELLQARVLREYPPLPEVEGGIVSQCEHSVIVRDKPIIYTKV